MPKPCKHVVHWNGGMLFNARENYCYVWVSEKLHGVSILGLVHIDLDRCFLDFYWKEFQLFEKFLTS